MADTRTPVLFIHGLWLHSESWSPWFEPLRAAGYEPIAPEWPGTGASVALARAHPKSAAGYGVVEIADHYAQIIESLRIRPVVIGHSFGGLLAQILLGRGVAAGAVAIDPAPIKGVLPLPFSALRVASIALRNPANAKGMVSLTADQFHFGFGNAVSRQESDEIFERWAIPSPGRPLFQAAFANVNPKAATRVDTANATRGPLLITAGGKDNTVPPSMVRAAHKLYRRSPALTELIELPDRGHSLTVDSGSAEVSALVVQWLRKHLS